MITRMSFIDCIVDTPLGQTIYYQWDTLKQLYRGIEPLRPIGNFLANIGHVDGNSQITTILLSHDTLIQGTVHSCRIIGSLTYMMSDKTYHLLIATPQSCRAYNHIKTVHELPYETLQWIEHFVLYGNMNQTSSTYIHIDGFVSSEKTKEWFSHLLHTMEKDR